MKEGKSGAYLKYAFGEIALVVIGILIALQVNNINEARKTRTKEVAYLKNIKTDLNINIQEMNEYINIRSECINAASRILEHFEGKPLTDLNAFNEDAISIYDWQKFWQNNNTFQELVNSGNLALISNDSIKNGLLNLETLYKKLKSEEDHYRYDSETLIYGPVYELMDLNPQVTKHVYVITNGQAGANVQLSHQAFNRYLKNIKAKNGFVMTVLEFSKMNEQMTTMIKASKELIDIIDREIRN